MNWTIHLHLLTAECSTSVRGEEVGGKHWRWADGFQTGAPGWLHFVRKAKRRGLARDSNVSKSTFQSFPSTADSGSIRWEEKSPPQQWSDPLHTHQHTGKPGGTAGSHESNGQNRPGIMLSVTRPRGLSFTQAEGHRAPFFWSFPLLNPKTFLFHAKYFLKCIFKNQSRRGRLTPH